MNYSEENKGHSNSIKMGTILRGISGIEGTQNPFVYVSRDGDNVHTLHQIDANMESFVYKHDDQTNPTLYEVVGKVDLMGVIKSGLHTAMNPRVKVRRVVKLVLLKDCYEGKVGRKCKLRIYSLDNQATEREISEYISETYLFDMAQWRIEEIKII